MRPVLFDDAVEAVLAVLEMVEAIFVIASAGVGLPWCCLGAVRREVLLPGVRTNRCLRRRAPRRGCPQTCATSKGREGRAFLPALRGAPLA